MIKCPDCSHENDNGTVICEICGRLLIQPSTATKVYDDVDFEKGIPRWGSARFAGTNLVIDVVDTKHSFVFEYDEIIQLIIGRKDAKDKNSAFLDLTTVGGLEKGVSRQHAFIERKEAALTIVDNKSANGTYLNGQKLVPKQPRVLRDGDEIRLGYLTLRITFRAKT